MLIDEFMPAYHFHEKHSVEVTTNADDLWSKMKHTEIGTDWITQLLFRLRGMPNEPISIAEFGKGTFSKLGEDPGSEIIFGIKSRNGRFSRCSPPAVTDFLEPDKTSITSVINFRLERMNETTRIVTETRVFCGNDQLKKEFRIYWFFVEPFSRLIRRRMLKQLKSQLEEQHTCSSASSE